MPKIKQSFAINLGKVSDLTGLDKKTILGYLKAKNIQPINKTDYDFSEVISAMAEYIEVIPPIRKIHTIWISKGGVGKTTTSILLSMMLAVKGYKILLMDLDGQLNLTNFFGVDISKPYYGISDIFAKGFKFEDAVYNVTQNIDLVPGTSDINSLLSALDKVINKESLFQRKILGEGHLEKYDFVFIDTHSSENTLLINALGISDSVLMPINPDMFNAQGLAKTYDVIDYVEQGLGIHIEKRILFSRLNPKNPVQNDVLKIFSEREKGNVYEAVIRNMDDISNAISLISPLEIKNSSQGYKAYLKLTQEFENDHVLEIPLSTDLIFGREIELNA